MCLGWGGGLPWSVDKRKIKRKCLIFFLSSCVESEQFTHLNSVMDPVKKKKYISITNRFKFSTKRVIATNTTISCINAIV